MAIDINTLGVGDVLVTGNPNPSLVARILRIGDRLHGGSGLGEHVIVAHHRDDAGTWWGIEGRPGGVGWRDLTQVVTWPRVWANTAQPRTAEQRYLIAVACERMLDVAYDWTAITADARQAFNLWHVFCSKEWEDGEVPAQMVCSAFADWAYEEVFLPNPGGTKRTRYTLPGDWHRFITTSAWT
jgi:hypothetical protein